MKEFDFPIENIFGGLFSARVLRKGEPGLEECHNIEPTEKDYILYEAVVDMNATGQDWNNSQDLIDYWQDNQNDDWQDNQNDDFEDI